MSTSRAARVRAIFEQALRCGEAERPAFLDQACAGDARLRSDVEAMMRQAASGETALLTETPVEPLHSLPLGLELGGRFLLKKFLGRGGMGEVYLAEDRELGGVVAVKTVRGGVLDEKGAARFRREVQLARQVTHPNVCRVFDVGKENLEGRELIYLSMEYLEGETLARRMARLGKIPIPEAEGMLRQLAAALDALHQKGIMHRDLKPGNVMLVGEKLFITDFGLARAFAGEVSDEQYTQTGAVLGTPGYMAPEQLSGDAATSASDIYAMGLLLYEMLTGEKATLGDALAPGKTGLPRQWERLILECLRRDAAARPKSAGEALQLLDEDAGSSRKSWRKVAIAAAVAAGLALLSFPLWKTAELRRFPGGTSVSVNDEIQRARQLMRDYYKPQNVKAAMEILEGAIQRHPDLALGHAALAAALYQTTAERGDALQVERAQEASKRAIALDPEMAEPRVTLGSIYLDAGKRDLARSELKRALELDSKLPEVHFALAKLYRAEGRMAEKDAAIRKAIDLAPDNWALHNWLSLEYRDQGKNDEALSELRIAERLMPQSPLIYNNFGVLYLRTRQYGEAEKAFQKSIELEPRARSLGNLANVYYLQGKYEDAVAVLSRAAAMEPKSYLLRANLAASLDRIPARRAAARESYRQAIELAAPQMAATPNDHRLLANVASYCAFLGQREKALALIRRAVALRPESPDVANRAMSVYEFLQERTEALRWAAKAVENGYPRETIQSDPEMAGLTKDPRFAQIGKPGASQ